VIESICGLDCRDVADERPTDWVQSGRFSIVAHLRGGDKTQI
jgi:hypothetical protein